MPPLWSPLIWLLVAGVLLVVELVQPSFDGLMFAVFAGLVVSVLTALLPLQVWIQIILFSVITVLGTLWLSRWSAQRNPRPGRRRLKDNTAEVLGTIEPGGEGRVRWQGQSWAASSLDVEAPLQAGERVLVISREGTQLQVLPSPPLP
ncbi:NfeD-like family protein YbbJ [Synechococcus sp. BIOS-U3-1]|uniref:NfeD family protein n=1 Tax=Synechococcus sp. BIOS-U3-1 TaxID=1400865 RepID=UPI00164675D8|nr:NfeD family protein [Synechococcus sp. BIOS-U3-1]QNI59374.1 NfeD-like family protein YbbJ [Synechococcus sp. BIOS-U3-1]